VNVLFFFVYGGKKEKKLNVFFKSKHNTEELKSFSIYLHEKTLQLTRPFNKMRTKLKNKPIGEPD
jgi:hypothetical protein